MPSGASRMHATAPAINGNLYSVVDYETSENIYHQHSASPLGGKQLDGTGVVLGAGASPSD